jgi:hypothetical protein
MHGRHTVTRAGEPRCAAPIEFEKLVAWWLGELPEAAAAPLEEHLFGCAHCTRRMEELAALAEGVRAAVRGGRVSIVVSAPFVEAMKRSGMRLREYRIRPGESVNCTIRADEDAVISHIGGSLGGVTRVDVVQRVSVGGVDEPELRLEDVPFDPAAGEVLFIPEAAALKAMPAHTVRMRLIAVGEAGEAPLGEYTFVHTPS